MTTHTKVTINGLVGAVRTALGSLTGAVVEIDEGIADKRTIMVYSPTIEGAHNSRTDRNTFGGGLQLRQIIVRIDCFSQPRANIGEDITAAQTDADAIAVILESKKTSPAFGLSGVHTFHWTGEIGILPAYAGAEYWGSQFELTFMCH